MREAYRKKLVFIGKSLVWSVFLYFSAIAILDWNYKETDEPIIVEVKYTPSNSIRVDASIQQGIKGTTYSLSALTQKLGSLFARLLN
ncbi:MAG: hypothetical protein R2800_13345 [Flavipsychrobacter sp.]